MTIPDSVTPWWQQLWQSQKDNLRLLLLAAVLALLIRGWIAEPRFIPSDSMLPTLHVGDRLIVEKVSYQLHPPRPGDIVVFQPPPVLQQAGYRADQAFIKRVIAQPGQTVQVHQGQVLVDGNPLTEPYLAEPPVYEWGPYLVPEGGLFVMGDNRNNSNDSHIWGFLPEGNVIGRAWLRFWPLDRWGRVNTAIATPLESTTPLS
ncbi:signal peptidase I [Synechococcus elongatus IITB4]|uniref:signal peptidase I n=1 Tax=Synechococcus elongatus TaxID=32046 RepID=UPI0030CDBA12